MKPRRWGWLSVLLVLLLVAAAACGDDDDDDTTAGTGDTTETMAAAAEFPAGSTMAKLKATETARRVTLDDHVLGRHIHATAVGVAPRLDRDAVVAGVEQAVF